MLTGCDTITTVSDISYTKEHDLTYDGVSYDLNDHISNFLLLGIDMDALVETSEGSADAGQADVQYVLSWNRSTGDVTLVSIPRDTITSVEAYSFDGTSLGKIQTHISYAYAYGDGKYGSLEMAKDAVEDLLQGVPIQSALALSMGCFETIIETIGNIDIVLPNDSLSYVDPTWVEGATITVTPENCETVIRNRDIGEDETAIYRSERQDVFLSACYERLKELYASDPEIITRLYTNLEEYMVSSLGVDQIIKIMDGIENGGTLTQWTIPGQTVETNRFEEFHVDEDELMTLVIETFYEVAE